MERNMFAVKLKVTTRTGVTRYETIQSDFPRWDVMKAMAAAAERGEKAEAVDPRWQVR
jgi:hypothetical protein